ncbi:hypothetical protein HK405_011380, partial [Cladochytrium tenue]
PGFSLPTDDASLNKILNQLPARPRNASQQVTARGASEDKLHTTIWLSTEALVLRDRMTRDDATRLRRMHGWENQRNELVTLLTQVARTPAAPGEQAALDAITAPLTRPTRRILPRLVPSESAQRQPSQLAPPQIQPPAVLPAPTNIPNLSPRSNRSSDNGGGSSNSSSSSGRGGDGAGSSNNHNGGSSSSDSSRSSSDSTRRNSDGGQSINASFSSLWPTQPGASPDLSPLQSQTSDAVLALSMDFESFVDLGPLRIQSRETEADVTAHNSRLLATVEVSQAPQPLNASNERAGFIMPPPPSSSSSQYQPSVTRPGKRPRTDNEVEDSVHSGNGAGLATGLNVDTNPIAMNVSALWGVPQPQVVAAAADNTVNLEEEFDLEGAAANPDTDIGGGIDDFTTGSNTGADAGEPAQLESTTQNPDSGTDGRRASAGWTQRWRDWLGNRLRSWRAAVDDAAGEVERTLGTVGFWAPSWATPSRAAPSRAAPSRAAPIRAARGRADDGDGGGDGDDSDDGATVVGEATEIPDPSTADGITHLAFGKSLEAGSGQQWRTALAAAQTCLTVTSNMLRLVKNATTNWCRNGNLTEHLTPAGAPLSDDGEPNVAALRTLASNVRGLLQVLGDPYKCGMLSSYLQLWRMAARGKLFRLGRFEFRPCNSPRGSIEYWNFVALDTTMANRHKCAWCYECLLLNEKLCGGEVCLEGYTKDNWYAEAAPGVHQQLRRPECDECMKKGERELLQFKSGIMFGSGGPNDPSSWEVTNGLAVFACIGFDLNWMTYLSGGGAHSTQPSEPSTEQTQQPPP